MILLGAIVTGLAGLLQAAKADLILDLLSGLEVDVSEPELEAPEPMDDTLDDDWEDDFFMWNGKAYGEWDDDFDYEAHGFRDAGPDAYKPTPKPYKPKLGDDGGDSKPTGNCMEVGAWRPFFNIALAPKFTKSAQECQNFCQNISDCNWWQWYSNDRKLMRQRNLRGKCELKTCMAPVADIGYTTMRIKVCDDNFCEDKTGKRIPKGTQTIYYAKNNKPSRRVLRNDPRSYLGAMINGPKYCDEKPGNCSDVWCTKGSSQYIGATLMEGNFQFKWDEIAPMQQCREKCESNEFCKTFSITFGPEFSTDIGPWYCTLHAEESGFKKVANAFSGPATCEKCAKIDVINMTANGELEDVSASEKEMYMNVFDNCDSHTAITGHYKNSVETSVTKVSQISFSRTLQESFSHSVTNHFGVEVDVTFKFGMIGGGIKVGYDLTDKITESYSESETTTEMQQTQKTKVTVVDSGFSYTVPPGKKLKIQATSKRIDGVLPWKANSRCIDKHGKVVEENNMFGNYKSYGLSTSEVEVFDLPCDDGTPAPTGSGGVCDFIFTPGGACTACGMKPTNSSEPKGDMEWVCTHGCGEDDGCECVPPFIYDGSGKCKPDPGPGRR